MIVPDSSVWISLFHAVRTPAVLQLLNVEPIDLIVGDLVLLEILQGATSEKVARDLERKLLQFTIAEMLGHHIAIRAAENYRRLRREGTTPKRTPDLIIATYCIENGYQLLHQDRDFGAFERHLGLKVLR
jgi:predicted nucleic acid-binding protein